MAKTKYKRLNPLTDSRVRLYEYSVRAKNGRGHYSIKASGRSYAYSVESLKTTLKRLYPPSFYTYKVRLIKTNSQIRKTWNT